MSRFGFSTEPSSGGDLVPIVKYDAKAGRMFRIDRTQDGGGNYVNTPVDITGSFKAIVDFENVETGWINFATGGAPDFRLVPMGQALPGRPSDGHKNGIRVMLKLSKECGGEKPIREIAGVAKAFLGAVEKVFDDYDAGRAEHPGQLPILVMDGAPMPVKSGTGAKQSTNYVPKFRIAGWAPRGDLIFTPKDGSARQVAAAPAAAPATTPPVTGSTLAPPPAARPAPAPATAQPEMADADDFG